MKPSLTIEVISKKAERIDGLLSHVGKITIGDYKETFIMPLNTWKRKDYEKQWKEGLERIKTHKRSCLVSTIQNFYTNPVVIIWALYRQKDTLFIQEHLLTAQTLKKSSRHILQFNKNSWYQFVSTRKTTVHNEKISEWSIKIKELWPNGPKNKGQKN